MTRLRRLVLFSFLLGLWACTPPPSPSSDMGRAEEEVTLTAIPATPSPQIFPRLSPIPATPTATPLACPTRPGRVEQGSVDSTKPPQEFIIYLPPCYDERPSLRYPVLYLLHGQTYTDDQWVRLGAVDVADGLISSGRAAPFLIVFPDDRYWNLPAGPGFGQRLVDTLIPYVDEHFRTISDREHRALGGLSRGGGWALRLGLTRWDLFGTLGLHSPAIFAEDAPFVDDWLKAIPSDSWPRLWMDAGDRDRELGSIRLFEDTLSRFEVPHEWHLYTGDHTESYWSAHVAEYIQWYAEGWTPQE